jgi:hypothetical protein
MKLRFHNNQLRLRLSQSEVAHLKANGRVNAEVKFASGALSYSLEGADRASAIFEDGSIHVELPRAAITKWIESDETGIEAASGPLRILVEKDFACAHGSVSENADTFPRR